MGSLMGGSSQSASSRSGDASSGLSMGDFMQNAAFSVGGSGTLGQTADNSKATDAGGGSSNTLYVIGAIAGLAIVAVVFAARRA